VRLAFSSLSIGLVPVSSLPYRAIDVIRLFVVSREKFSGKRTEGPDLFCEFSRVRDLCLLMINSVSFVSLC